jgi:hypothetical protein
MDTSEEWYVKHPAITFCVSDKAIPGFLAAGFSNNETVRSAHILS